MLFCVATKSQSPSPANQRTDPQGGRSDQPKPQPPINITVTAPKPSAEDAHKEDQYRQREVAAQEDVRDFTRMLTILAVMQAVITLVALGASIRSANAAKMSAVAAESSAVIALAQKRIGDRQLAQMDAQIEIARVNADAAKQSAETAALALHLTERADLAIDRIEADEIGGDLIADTTVTVYFQNRGRTRANQTTFSGTLGIPGGQLLPERGGAPIIVAAGDQAAFAFDGRLGDFIPPDALTGINAGEHELRITGLLSYVDVFERGHRIQFEGRWHRERSAFATERYEAD
jgi:hypothetical protein